jgi:hypothetical protein
MFIALFALPSFATSGVRADIQGAFLRTGRARGY